MEHHLFDIRSPRGGGYYDDYYDDYDYRWPLYIYIVISVLSFMAFLFFWSLVFYTVKEMRRRRSGQRFRFGHVIWGAFKIASFLWIPIGIYHCCCSSKRHKNTNNSNAGNYAQINEYQGAAGVGAYAANGNNAWYGAPAPAAAAYGAGGMGYAPPGKFEPMGYAGATGASIPLAPMNAPAQQQTGMAPAVGTGAPPQQMVPPMTTGYVSAPGTPAPPPYPGTPHAAAAAPPMGGAAQEYYASSAASAYPASTMAPTPPAQATYPPQPTSYSPGQGTPPATITYPPPTSYAPATQQQTGYMSATCVPQQNSAYFGQ